MHCKHRDLMLDNKKRAFPFMMLLVTTLSSLKKTNKKNKTHKKNKQISLFRLAEAFWIRCKQVGPHWKFLHTHKHIFSKRKKKKKCSLISFETRCVCVCFFLYKVSQETHTKKMALAETGLFYSSGDSVKVNAAELSVCFLSSVASRSCEPSFHFHF